VPRSRFLPVKKTSDLLLVMSNLYSLRNGSLVMSSQRMFPTTPLVKLGDNHFSKVSSLTSGSEKVNLLYKVKKKKHRCHKDL
jgi:UDP-N-acetylglucosamine pyrophosphorylase